MNKLIVVMMVAAAFAGCGKPKLTDEQKGIIADTMSAAGRSQSSARSANKAPDPSPEQPVPPAKPTPDPRAGLLQNAMAQFALNTSDATVTAVSTDETQGKMEKILRKKHADKACNVDMGDADKTPSPSSTNPGTPPGAGMPSGPATDPMASAPTGFHMKIKVDGDACPVSMDMGMDMTLSPADGTGEANVRMHYSVKDEEFRKLNDVDAMNLEGKMTFKGSSDSVDFNADMKGNINSQKTGNIDMIITGKGHASKDGGKNVEMVMTLKYPKFVAEFKIKQDGKQIDYYANDEKVSKEEFERLLKNGGLAGSGTLSSGVSGDPANSSGLKDDSASVVSGSIL